MDEKIAMNVTFETRKKENTQELIEMEKKPEKKTKFWKIQIEEVKLIDRKEVETLKKKKKIGERERRLHSIFISVFLCMYFLVFSKTTSYS